MSKTYHKLRERIVLAIAANPAGYMSPNELEKELDESLSQVSYHVKILREQKALVLVKTIPRRGAVEHYYEVADHVWDHDGEALDQIAEWLGDKAARGDEPLLPSIAQAVSETGRKIKGFKPKKSKPKAAPKGKEQG